MQSLGTERVALTLASPVLLSGPTAVCAATLPPQTTAAATPSTPSGVPLNLPVEASSRTRPLTCAVRAPSFFSFASPEASFHTFPQERTSPIGALVGQAVRSPLTTTLIILFCIFSICAHPARATRAIMDNSGLFIFGLLGWLWSICNVAGPTTHCAEPAPALQYKRIAKQSISCSPC